MKVVLLAALIRTIEEGQLSWGEKRGATLLAADEKYVTPTEFKTVYEQARKTRAAVRGFINYLRKYEARKTTRPEPSLSNR